MSLPVIGRRPFVAAWIVMAALGPVAASAQDFAQVAAGIQRLYAALLAVMKAGAAKPFTQRYTALAQPVAQALDLPAILQVAVGPAWAALPAAQQSALQAAFQKYSVATYVSQFDSYNGERLEVLPGLRTLPNGQPVLHSEIVSSSGDTHAIDYVMRQTPEGWKAVDVLLDGTISRVAVLRSDFRRLLARGGPTELTNFLQQKATDLSGMTSPP
jgi:phospholipid transport system substrate-binding protein